MTNCLIGLSIITIVAIVAAGIALFLYARRHPEGYEEHMGDIKRGIDEMKGRHP